MSSEEDAGQPVDDMRNAWIYGRHISTVPRWARVQDESIREAGLPDIAADTRRKIVRQLILTLVCHTCEKKLTDQCDFSVCVRGIMSRVIQTE
ncbi:MAG: hypothetical protein V3V91_08550 [Thermoplasmata archaeon]